MHRRILVALTLAVLAPASATAQGLLWSLPEDGTWVRYEGEYRHVRFKNFDRNDDGSISPDERPSTEDAQRSYACGEEADYAQVMCWQREVWIRSVGREQVAVERAVAREERRLTPEGVKFVPVLETETKPVTGRWIEIKTVTGKKTDIGLDAGPAGAQIYKVLVPEDAVADEPFDAESIPLAYVPILKGYKKLGNSPVKPITEPVLQVYPVLSLIAQYRRVEPLADRTEDAGVPLGPVSARRFEGELVAESRTDRSRNVATLWRSDEVPFGLARWEVTIVREQKDGTVERAGFEPVSRIHVEMKAVATGADATSELVVPDELQDARPRAEAPAIPE